MSKILALLTLVLIATTQAFAQVAITEENFPDTAFCSHIIGTYDTDKDSVLSADELSKATALNITDEVRAVNLKGIEHLTSLNEILVTSKSIKEIDLSALTSLKVLTLDMCDSVKSLTLPSAGGLDFIKLYACPLDSVDLSAQTSLKTLFVKDCPNIDTLDVSSCSQMTYLMVYNVPLTKLDLSGASALTEIELRGTSLGSLDVSGMSKLKWLSTTGDKTISSLDVSKNYDLEALEISGSSISKMDLSANIKLVAFVSESTGLSSLKLTEGSVFKTLDIAGNNIPFIDLENMSGAGSHNYTADYQKQEGVSNSLSSRAYNCSLSPQTTAAKMTALADGRIAFILPNAIDTSKLESVTANGDTIAKVITAENGKKVMVIANSYDEAKALATNDTVKVTYTYLTGHPKATETAYAALYRMRVNMTGVIDFAAPEPIEPEPVYDVTIDSSIENGTISVSPSQAVPGTVVTVTATPNSGYKLNSISVVDADGNPITMTGDTFVMPASGVTINASFVKVAPASGNYWICP